MKEKSTIKIFKTPIIALLMTVLCFAFAMTASAETVGGNCGKDGDNVTWSLDTETGVLTISGEGDMEDYRFGSNFDDKIAPWRSYSINSVTIKEGVTTVGECAFYKCTELKDVILPNSISLIKCDAFASCSEIAQIELPYSLTGIYSGAFNSCSKLEEIDIPDSVTSIGDGAFRECSSLKRIKLSNNITCIDYNTFNNCKALTEITIPNSVTKIVMCAFEGCSSLVNVSIPNSVNSIGDNAFSDCSSLVNINIPNSVKLIGACAFFGCCSLPEINIPNSISSINYGVFSWCTSLRKVNIPNTVTSIDECAFSYCISLNKFLVDSSNKHFSADNYGALYNKDKSVLISYPAGSKNTEYIMPDSVNKVCTDAFLYCTFLEKIVFSDSVKEIDSETVTNCFALTDLVLPKACSRLGEIAIALNPSLKTLTIKSMDAQFDELSVCASILTLKDNYSLDDFRNELYSSEHPDIDSIFEKYFDSHDDMVYIGTIICHSGSTAEAYAKENGIDYETVHFFGDWVYDWDNLFREHTCTICGYTEKENLEKETDGDVEIVKPTDPDKDFEVDKIEKNSSKYLLIEESFKQNHEGDYSILRSFDITLKNKDGVHVQPDGTVKVKLPNDWKKNGVYKVYRVNDDGTLTDMNAYRQGSHLVFETDHFSIYVIVDESGEQADTDDSGSDTSSNAFSKFLSKLKDLFKIIIEFFKSLGRK